MLLKPEGLWPEVTHKRELHESENDSGEATAAEPARNKA
jgi:hypothetical protein